MSSQNVICQTSPLIIGALETITLHPVPNHPEALRMSPYHRPTLQYTSHPTLTSKSRFNRLQPAKRRCKALQLLQSIATFLLAPLYCLLYTGNLKLLMAGN